MLSDWEILVLGSLLILLMFMMRPGVKAALMRSKQAPSDWQSVLLPLGLVVLFVVFLIAMV